MYVGIIELFLEFVKPVTLSMRLFGNIYGGEVALAVLTALTIAIIPMAMIALELGVSSRLCARLQPGQEVVVMGPTGAPTEIPRGENVLLAGGGLGNAVLFSIARAMRQNGNRVVYFAGYKRGEDLFKREEIEAATDQVVWSTDTGAPIEP